MKLATVYFKNMEQLMVGINDRFFLVSDINRSLNTDFPIKLQNLIEANGISKLTQVMIQRKDTIQKYFIPEPNKMRYRPLYRHPTKILGIGLNYAEHTDDLNENPPENYPASFVKPKTSIIGHGDIIKIPEISQQTTGEAELGIIMGREAKNISKENWINYVAGFTCIIDMTAEDILRQNPRYLTISKSFDTFFSFGPMMLTPDEIDDTNKLEISTVSNGETVGKNIVSNMKFQLDYLVSFHSTVMKFYPCDIISTGTPKAVTLHHGDKIECKIGGFESLTNDVMDLKI